MSDSILQTKKECYISGSRINLEKHHIMAGTANRKLSEKYGLWVWLNHDLHTGDHGAQYEIDLNLQLKRDAQKAFEEKYSHEKWMEVFGKNYL